MWQKEDISPIMHFFYSFPPITYLLQKMWLLLPSSSPFLLGNKTLFASQFQQIAKAACINQKKSSLQFWHNSFVGKELLRRSKEPIRSFEITATVMFWISLFIWLIWDICIINLSELVGCIRDDTTSIKTVFIIFE